MTAAEAQCGTSPPTYAPPPRELRDEPYVFSTLRFDPLLADCTQNTAASFNKPCPFYLLEHQWTRMKVAKWSALPPSAEQTNGLSMNGRNGPANFFNGLRNAIAHWNHSHPDERTHALRVRVRTYASGRITTEIHPILRIPLSRLFPEKLYIPQHVPTDAWTVVLDTEATPISESSMYKTSDRATYGRARALAGLSSLASHGEVIMYNPSNDVLDASQATPYFYRDRRWVTPNSPSGGQQGTTRRWALEQNICIEAVVPVSSLEYGEIVWLSNAVKGFYWAVYVPREKGRGGQGIEKDAAGIARQLC